MDLGNCTVRLGGDILNTVKKTMVTPAEVLVLKKIHGDDAVLDITRTAKDVNRPDRQEVDRLREIYVDRFGAANPDRPNIVKDLFPGAAPSLPATFDDIVDPSTIKDEVKAKPSTGKLTLNDKNEGDKSAA